MQTMSFNVGPLTLVVHIVARRPIDQLGRETDALIDHTRDEIYIFQGLGPARREHRLRHEINHAKRDILGVPEDEESSCDLDAAFWQQFDREFREQGGGEALAAMVPEAEELEVVQVVEGWEEVPEDDESAEVFLGEYTLEPVTDRGESPAARLGTARRRDCVCGRMIYERRIVDETPRIEPAVGGWVVDRSMYCADCVHVQLWTEGVGPGGLPNGVPIDEPTFITGWLEVAAWLEEHPQGVEVADVG